MDICLSVADVDGFIVAKKIKEKLKINCITNSTLGCGIQGEVYRDWDV